MLSHFQHTPTKASTPTTPRSAARRNPNNITVPLVSPMPHDTPPPDRSLRASDPPQANFIHVSSGLRAPTPSDQSNSQGGVYSQGHMGVRESSLSTGPTDSSPIRLADSYRVPSAAFQDHHTGAQQQHVEEAVALAAQRAYLEVVARNLQAQQQSQHAQFNPVQAELQPSHLQESGRGPHNTLADVSAIGGSPNPKHQRADVQSSQSPEREHMVAEGALFRNFGAATAQSAAPPHSGQGGHDPRSVSSSTQQSSLDDERKELKELRAVLQNAALSVRQQEQSLAKGQEDLEQRLSDCREKEEILKARTLEVAAKEQKIQDEVNAQVMKWKEDFMNSPQARLAAQHVDEEHLRKIHRELQSREDDVVAQEKDLERDQDKNTKLQVVLREQQVQLQAQQDELLKDSERHAERFGLAKQQMELREADVLNREKNGALEFERNKLKEQDLARQLAALAAQKEALAGREASLGDVLVNVSTMESRGKELASAAERLDQREETLWEISAKAGSTAPHTNYPVFLSVMKTDLESLNQQLRQVSTMIAPPPPMPDVLASGGIGTSVSGSAAAGVGGVATGSVASGVAPSPMTPR